jgi:hypothetical protein
MLNVLVVVVVVVALGPLNRLPGMVEDRGPMLPVISRFLHLLHILMQLE